MGLSRISNLIPKPIGTYPESAVSRLWKHVQPTLRGHLWCRNGRYSASESEAQTAMHSVFLALLECLNDPNSKAVPKDGEELRALIRSLLDTRIKRLQRGRIGNRARQQADIDLDLIAGTSTPISDADFLLAREQLVAELLNRLGENERTAVGLLLSGATVREIGPQMNLSVRTIQRYIDKAWLIAKQLIEEELE